MYNRTEIADRRRRTKAIFITIGLQLALLAVLVFGGQLSVASLLPESLREALGMEAPAAPAVSEDAVAVRP